MSNLQGDVKKSAKAFASSTWAAGDAQNAGTQEFIQMANDFLYLGIRL